jgi:hypothetical protein
VAGSARVHLLSHVSDRYDRAMRQRLMAEWSSLHPRGLTDEAVEIVEIV